MADDKTKRGSPDGKLVSLTAGDVLGGRCKSLRFTDAEVRTDMKAVGNSAHAVREHLRSQH